MIINMYQVLQIINYEQDPYREKDFKVPQVFHIYCIYNMESLLL